MPNGRPSKLTPAVADRIVEAINAGASLRLAAAHGGVSQSTLFRWLAEGEEAGRGAKREFWERVTAARSSLFVELGQVVRQGAMKDPRLALATMRALFAADLEPQHAQVTDPGAGPLIGEADRAVLMQIIADPAAAAALQAAGLRAMEEVYGNGDMAEE